MRFDLNQVQGLLVCLIITKYYFESKIVCFSQEESVADLISEVCPFLKGMKRRNRDPLRYTGHKVLSSLNCVSTMVVRTGIVTGDTL